MTLGIVATWLPFFSRGKHEIIQCCIDLKRRWKKCFLDLEHNKMVSRPCGRHVTHSNWMDINYLNTCSSSGIFTAASYKLHEVINFIYDFFCWAGKMAKLLRALDYVPSTHTVANTWNSHSGVSDTCIRWLTIFVTPDHRILHPLLTATGTCMRVHV